MAWVEARCSGGHLWFRLDPERGLIEVRCALRGCRDHGPVLHHFDARTGQEVSADDAAGRARPGQPEPAVSRPRAA